MQPPACHSNHVVGSRSRRPRPWNVDRLCRGANGAHGNAPSPAAAPITASTNQVTEDRQAVKQATRLETHSDAPAYHTADGPKSTTTQDSRVSPRRRGWRCPSACAAPAGPVTSVPARSSPGFALHATTFLGLPSARPERPSAAARRAAPTFSTRPFAPCVRSFAVTCAPSRPRSSWAAAACGRPSVEACVP